MRKYLKLSILMLLPIMASCQTKTDLQKPLLAGDVRETYLKDKKRHADGREVFTTLPCYYTHDVEGFIFGPVNFTHGGEAGPNEDANLGNNTVTFILKSVTERTPIGLIIQVEKSEEARQLFDYVQKTYKGKLISQLQTRMKGKQLVNGSFLYPDVKPGVSMLLTFNSDNTKNGKPATTTRLYLLKDDTKPAEGVSKPTVLALLTEMFSQ